MKITIVGAGRVGSTSAYMLLERALADEILLLDIAGERAAGEALDLTQGLSGMGVDAKVEGSADYADSADSDIIVVTAGIPRKPGDTRLDLAEKNKGLVEKMTDGLMEHNKNPVLLMVSNPVDLMTLIAYRRSGLKSARCFGLGTMLDSIRYRSLLAKTFDVPVKQVEAWILGEHGDSMFPATSLLRMPGKDTIAREDLDGVFPATRDGAAKVIKWKGGTFYAPAVAVAEVVEALVDDSEALLPVSVYQEELGVCISVPSRVNAGGAHPQKLELSEGEMESFNKSVATLKDWASKAGID